MSREQTSKKEKISIFGEIANGYRTDDQKIKFFDTSNEAFFTDEIEAPLSVNENIAKDLDDGFYVFANTKKPFETDLEELRSLNWKENPKKP